MPPLPPGLRRFQRQLAAEHDAQIYCQTGDYPDLVGMHEGRDYADLD